MLTDNSSLPVNGTSQSLGSSVQIPDGQSSAPRAEHLAAQLSPIPHVSSSVSPVSGKQQTTVLLWFADDTACSKASIELFIRLGLGGAAKDVFSSPDPEGVVSLPILFV